MGGSAQTLRQVTNQEIKHTNSGNSERSLILKFDLVWRTENALTAQLMPSNPPSIPVRRVVEFMNKIGVPVQDASPVERLFPDSPTTYPSANPTRSFTPSTFPYSNPTAPTDTPTGFPTFSPTFSPTSTPSLLQFFFEYLNDDPFQFFLSKSLVIGIFRKF